MRHWVPLATVRFVATLSPEMRSDAELLRAHAAGDRRAFEELVRRHRTRLYRTARRRAATPEDADDALQDALLKAHRAAGSFRQDATVGSWLHRIVVNSCVDRFRRDALGPSLIREDPGIATEAVPVADRTAQVDTAIVVRQALMRLPLDQRSAVVAVDMHGYSIAEAAALFRVAEGTVKSRCSRARARLAALLGQQAH